MSRSLFILLKSNHMIIIQPDSLSSGSVSNRFSCRVRWQLYLHLYVINQATVYIGAHLMQLKFVFVFTERKDLLLRCYRFKHYWCHSKYTNWKRCQSCAWLHCTLLCNQYILSLVSMPVELGPYLSQSNPTPFSQYPHLACDWNI